MSTKLSLLSFTEDLKHYPQAPTDRHSEWIADLRSFVNAIEDFLEGGETSDPDEYDPTGLELEAVQRGGYLHAAVCRVERHYPLRKLPSPEPRNPWRCLLQACRREEDLFMRQNMAHIHAKKLMDWAELELTRLSIATTVEDHTDKKPGVQRSPKRSWTQADLDEAIRKYKAERATTYNDLVDGVKLGKAGAKRSARKMFGRNAVSRALGVKSSAMVSGSAVWQAIADELCLRGVHRSTSTQKTQRIGLDMALEEQAVAQRKQVLDQAVQRETIRLIERSMPAKEAEATIEKLQRGDITDDEARQLVEVVVQQQQDVRTRKVRQGL